MADLDLAIGDKALAFASGGSGSTSSISRSSASNLLFGIPLLLISLSLLFLSRRYARLRSSIGLTLCAALATWALTVSRQNGQSFIAGTDNGNTNDIIIWAITAVISILAAILGATFLWPIGILGMAVSAGFAFALEILLLGSNGLIHSAGGRWAWITIWSLASFATIVFIKHKQRHWVELIQSTITGTFIFSLSIDLLANGANGASTGLRYILDTNSYHHAALIYKPKLSTQLLMPLAWLLTPILAYAQYRLFPKAQEWPTKSNWFFEVRNEDEADTNIDRSKEGSGTSSTSSSENLDAEKAIGNAKHGSVHDTPASSAEGQRGDLDKTSSETTLVEPGQNTFTRSQNRPLSSEIRNSFNTLRINPPRLPRSHSFPSQPSRGVDTARRGASPTSSINRNSSAYPFPSVFQLMDPSTNTAAANDNMQLGPPPPNSRHNSRRKSWIPYSTPSLSLNPHQEDDGRISLDQLERGGGQDTTKWQTTQAGKSGASSVEEGNDADGTHTLSNTILPPATSSAPDSDPYPESEQGRTSPEMITAASSLSSHEEQDYTDAQALPSGTQALSVPMREAKSSSSSSDAVDDENIPSTAGTSVTSLDALEAQDEQGKDANIAASADCKILYTAPEGLQKNSLHLDSVYQQDEYLHGTIIASLSCTAVKVRTTINDWATFTDTPALMEGSKTIQGAKAWSFTLQAYQLEDFSTVQMAIAAIDENGKEEWDSNEGKNYTFSLNYT